jgi:16S rRNA (adenine1518-N6/adenine1519-N6)-dimethyltransferase
MANPKRVKPTGSEAAPQGMTAPQRAKKSLGQNFLNDREIAHRIVEALGDISQKTVIEIGPGRGALTGLLIARAARLIAIELDRVLAAQMRMKCANVPNIEVIEADVLAVDFASLLGPRPGTSIGGLTPKPPEKVPVVGNIPYYITSDILLRLFEYHPLIETIVIMVQKEVAERIVAKPGTSEYGLLSATCQLYAQVEKLFTVPAESFSPAPKVDSAVLRLTIAPRWEKLKVDPEAFIKFLKLSFAQKRKTLANNLKPHYEGKTVLIALEKAKVSSNARAEALSLEKTAAVFRALSASN